MRKYYLLLPLLLASVVMWAAPVSREAAQQRASEFLSARHPQHARRAIRAASNPSALKPASQEAYYHVFNIGEGDGFVIVSGDDRTVPIIGYTDSGTFNEQTLPVNVRAWLNDYADQLRWLEAHPSCTNEGDERRAPRRVMAKNVIMPLLSTLWDQYEPYNLLCPLFLNTTERCLSGCVATAMAQVMYYHQWPDATTSDIPAYNCRTNWGGYGRMAVTGIPANTALEWDKMHTTYSEGATDLSVPANQSVATLVAACGVSVEMDYRDAVNGGSSANSAAMVSALKNYFDYAATTRFVSRSDYTYDDWTDVIYQELEASRPVLYSGQSSGGGHAFVVDGFDGEGYFHVNWGWGGAHNGYFLLSVLNPGGNDGAGASNSNDGYSFDQDAIIGVKKNEGEPAPVVITAPMRGAIGSVSLTGGTATITSSYYSTYAETVDMDFGIGYVNTDGSFTPVATSWFASLPTDYGHPSQSFTVSGLPDGTYHIVPICKVRANAEWLSYLNPAREYVRCVVSGGTVTELTHVRPTATLAVVGFTPPASATTGQTLSVGATISNTGSSEYYGLVYLFASTTADKGTYKARGGITVQTGKSTTTAFEFSLPAEGTYTLWVATDENGQNVIGQTTLTVTEAGETTDNIDLAIAPPVISSLSTDGTKILSNQVTVTWTLTNNSDKNYNGQVNFYLYTWVSGGANLSWLYPTLNVPAHSSTTWSQTYDLDYGGTYSFNVEYAKNGAMTDLEPFVYNQFTCTHGTSYCTADGQLVFIEASPTMALPTSVTAVDLRGNSITTAVTGGNPNTIYFIDDEATIPTGATSNIVCNGEAEHIAITDGYDFGTPYTFVAHEITYTRTFQTGLSRSYSGWSTIVLPFDVSGVEVGFQGNYYPIDWFHSSSDEDKNFWIMQFDHENSGTVYFSHAAQFHAGRPYIIAVPGAEWGDDFDLTALPIRFKAADVTLSSEFASASIGDTYKMKGTIAAQELSNIYALNAEGTSFSHAATATVDAFRSYFATTATASSSCSALSIRTGDTPTAVLALRPGAEKVITNQSCYTLDGVRVPTPVRRGIYIRNGRKIVVQ